MCARRGGDDYADNAFKSSSLIIYWKRFRFLFAFFIPFAFDRFSIFFHFNRLSPSSRCTCVHLASTCFRCGCYCCRCPLDDATPPQADFFFDLMLRSRSENKRCAAKIMEERTKQWNGTEEDGTQKNSRITFMARGIFVIISLISLLLLFYSTIFFSLSRFFAFFALCIFFRHAVERAWRFIYFDLSSIETNDVYEFGLCKISILSLLLAKLWLCRWLQWQCQ